MLKSLESYPNFYYVDLTGIANSQAGWCDEMHLTNDGFKIAASRFHQKIQAVLNPDSDE